MGRSQRHNLWEHGATSAGEIHAEGVVAPGIVMQVDPEALNVLKAGPPLYNTGLELKEPPDMTGVAVPIGGPGGPLAGSSLTGAIPEELEPEPPAPEPIPGEEPTLNSINPSSEKCLAADLTMNVNGQRFTNTSVVYFQDVPMPTTFVDAAKLSVVVTPSIYETPIEVPVWVQQGSYKTDEKTFTFTDATVEGHRVMPLGPLTIVRIEDHDDGIAIRLADGDVREGDAVLIEATGNTNINGNYTVLSVIGLNIVIDNMVVLDTPIEAKGRLTVNGEV